MDRATANALSRLAPGVRVVVQPDHCKTPLVCGAHMLTVIE